MLASMRATIGIGSFLITQTSLSLLYKVLINKNILNAKINIEMGPNPMNYLY